MFVNCFEVLVPVAKSSAHSSTSSTAGSEAGVAAAALSSLPDQSTDTAAQLQEYSTMRQSAAVPTAALGRPATCYRSKLESPGPS